MRSHQCIDRSAVTMVEVLMSLVLVTTILLVCLTASANLLRNGVQEHNSSEGKDLAYMIMDEISAMDLQDREHPVFGLEPNEDATDRTTFNDVDDYHGFSMSPPTYRDGTLISGFDGWTVSVSISTADADVTGITTVSSNTDSLLRVIAVTCTTPDGSNIDAATLVSGVTTNLPSTESYDRWRRTKLTFPDGREVHVTAPLRNQPQPTY